MKLSEIKIGKIFTVAGVEFIKITDEGDACAVVAKDVAFNCEFGKNNNLSESTVLNRLKTEFLPNIEKAVGSENVKEFEVDLTSLDGLDTYGKINTKIAIPTFDFYRKNVRTFDKYKPECWWCLATPDTTKEHLNDYWTVCVSPFGNINYYDYNLNVGVRPFLYFVSSISVSCEE